MVGASPVDPTCTLAERGGTGSAGPHRVALEGVAHSAAGVLHVYRRVHSFSSGSTQLACGSGKVGAVCFTRPGSGAAANAERSAAGSLVRSSTVGSPQRAMSALRAWAWATAGSWPPPARRAGLGVVGDGDEVRVAHGAFGELPADGGGGQALGRHLVGGVVGVEGDGQQQFAVAHHLLDGAGVAGTACHRATDAGAAHRGRPTAAAVTVAKASGVTGRASAAASRVCSSNACLTKVVPWKAGGRG